MGRPDNQLFGKSRIHILTERALAHEMGHLISNKGTGEGKDDYEMRIIRHYENPVAQDLHEPLRTQHLEPPLPAE